MQHEYSEERLILALAPRQVRYIASIGSTNDVAREWLLQGEAEPGAVVVADEQTAGRGRHGRTWHTPPGVAVAASVIVQTSPHHIAQANMAGTLAVHHTLNTLQVPDLSIKWANDVLAGGKKISGILPEAIWDGDSLRGVVLGLGVNVRNDFSGTPLDGLATTIHEATSRQVDRVSLLAVLLYQLDSWLGRMGTEMIIAAYRRQVAGMLGHPVTVQGADGEMHGIALDVEPDGALVLRLSDNGELKRVYAGDVTVKKKGA